MVATEAGKSCYLWFCSVVHFLFRLTSKILFSDIPYFFHTLLLSSHLQFTPLCPSAHLKLITSIVLLNTHARLFWLVLFVPRKEAWPEESNIMTYFPPWQLIYSYDGLLTFGMSSRQRVTVTVRWVWAKNNMSIQSGCSPGTTENLQKKQGNRKDPVHNFLKVRMWTPDERKHTLMRCFLTVFSLSFSPAQQELKVDSVLCCVAHLHTPP